MKTDNVYAIYKPLHTSLSPTETIIRDGMSYEL